ncbi:MAG: phosphate signaling complex protein PhoU [Candidatus Brocadiia bacterium]
MGFHMFREVERLKKEILSLGAQVEEAVQKAARSIAQRDRSLAQGIIHDDDKIDSFEVEVEEECLKILALYQPVAIDLRYIISTLKINNDLERIGDLAVNIAQATLFLADYPRVDMPFDFTEMARKAQKMVSDALDSLVNMDAQLAREVCGGDIEVDNMHAHMYDLVERMGRTEPENVGALIRLLTVSHHLERIADHATNIAEDVIYMTEGRIVRHGEEKKSV